MIDVAHHARVDMAMKDAHNRRECEPPHRGSANHPNDRHRRVDERGAPAGQTPEPGKQRGESEQGRRVCNGQRKSGQDGPGQ